MAGVSARPPTAAQIDGCRRCALWRTATHGVAGAGPAPAPMMLIGEQPGDQEDLAALPFVGPAGRVLDELLLRAGITRAALFVTNAVKHFKWEPRGKRRLHRRPNAQELEACAPWLQQEIRAVRPRVIVLLGATAARALLGGSISIDRARRQLLRHESGARIFVTYHPSAVLRAAEDADRLREVIVGDLVRAAAALKD